jgi:hypothetical protein
MKKDIVERKISTLNEKILDYIHRGHEEPAFDVYTLCFTENIPENIKKEMILLSEVEN